MVTDPRQYACHVIMSTQFNIARKILQLVCYQRDCGVEVLAGLNTDRHALEII